MDYNNYNRRRPKRRITGRFFAFLTCLLVLVVMLGVFLKERNQSNTLESYQPQLKTTADSTVSTAQQTIQPQENMIPSDPMVTQNSQVQQFENPVQQQQVEQSPTQSEVPEELTPENGYTDINDMSLGDDLAMNEPLEQQDVVNDLKARTDLPPEWKNYLLLGSDTRNMKKLSRCDTIIIASINTVTGKIKLTSVMRDMVIEIPGHGQQKVNAATYYGGAKLMMQVLNENLGLNITEYAVVNFAGMSHIIDILGGIYVDITKEELPLINNHIGEIAMYTMEKQDYLNQREQLHLQTFGSDMLLNGMHAVTYARIREIGSDYARTDRQKAVLNGILKRIKGAGLGQLTQIATNMWQYFDTNINMFNAIGVAKSVLGSGLDKTEDWRIPGPETSKTKNGKLGQGFYDVDYPEITQRIHNFIYGSRFP